MFKLIVDDGKPSEEIVSKTELKKRLINLYEMAKEDLPYLDVDVIDMKTDKALDTDELSKIAKIKLDG